MIKFKYKNKDLVKIDWKKVTLSNGNFAKYGYTLPLKIIYPIPQFGQMYLVEDAKGLSEIIEEGALIPWLH